MPKPVYILCSESGSEDKATSLVSHFNVIEQIELRELPRPPEGMIPLVHPLSTQITAVWTRAEGDDPTHLYEFKITIFLPPDGKELPVGSGTFIFDKPRFRATAYVKGLVMNGPGSFRAEGRVRPVGSNEDSWVVQNYEIPVLHIKLAVADQPEPLLGESAHVNNIPE
jgi:hypothetical protein